MEGLRPKRQNIEKIVKKIVKIVSIAICFLIPLSTGTVLKIELNPAGVGIVTSYFKFLSSLPNPLHNDVGN